MEPQKVRALYSFTGQHTDELNFKKGDVITITQPIDGGWYEGTLRGVTGWFPANRVVEYHSSSAASGADTGVAADGQSTASTDYRATLLANIIDTEAAFVKDLDSFINSTLQPVWRLFGADYDLINRHLELTLEVHRTLLSGLRAEASRSPSKIGKVFLAIFPRLQAVHCNYCVLHPRVVKLIMKATATNADNNNTNNAFSGNNALSNHSNSNNANNNNIIINNNNNNNSSGGGNTVQGSANGLKLCAGLSAPFKRIERYETLLEELTRLSAENHPDRGDCQRSCSLFRELVQELSALRRQKNIETEILNANIRNWDSAAPISSLGEVRLTCPVTGHWQNGTKDHYLVAFDSALVLVSLYNPNEFQLDCKFPLDRTTITKVDKPLSLEIVFHNTRVLVTFHSSDDMEKLRSRVDVYSTVQKRSSSKSVDGALNAGPAASIRVGVVNGSRPATPDQRGGLESATNPQQLSWTNQQQQQQISRLSRPTSPAWPVAIPPRSSQQQQQQCEPSAFGGTTSRIQSSRMSLMVSKIRGVLPHRRMKVPLQKEPVPGLKRGSSARKNKKELPLPILPPEEPAFNTLHYERDLQILKAVEAFANLAKKPASSIPLTSLAGVGGAGCVTSASSVTLSSLPSVRVSTLTAHSSSPMDVDGMHTSLGPGRPLSISPVSPGASGDTQATNSIRNLQNDVTFLKEQMAKLQLDLQEERRQRKALQEQLNHVVTSVKRNM